MERIKTYEELMEKIKEIARTIAKQELRKGWVIYFLEALESELPEEEREEFLDSLHFEIGVRLREGSW